MKRKQWIFAALCVFALAALVLTGVLLHAKRFEPKRQSEEEIIAYQDSSKVELYYHNAYDAAVEIWAQIYFGDGTDTVAKGIVQPGETVTLLETIDGKPYDHFVPDIYLGRILVFDADSGRLQERKDELAFRLYHSYRDPYDALVSSAQTEREVVLDEKEYRPASLLMRVDLKTEEIRAGLMGLTAEWRELNSYIYAQIDGKEVLIAKEERLPPRTLYFELYLEPGVADLLNVGDVIPDVRVDSYYADTGEFYDSIPAEIYEVVRTD